MTTISSMYTEQLDTFSVLDEAFSKVGEGAQNSHQKESLDEPTATSSLSMGEVMRMLRQCQEESVSLSSERALGSFEARQAEIKANMDFKMEEFNKRAEANADAQKQGLFSKIFTGIALAVGVIATIATGGAAAVIAIGAVVATIAVLDQVLKATGVDDNIRSAVRSVGLAVGMIAVAVGSGGSSVAAQSSKFVRTASQVAQVAEVGSSLTAAGFKVAESSSRLDAENARSAIVTVDALFEANNVKYESSISAASRTLDTNASIAETRRSALAALYEV